LLIPGRAGVGAWWSLTPALALACAALGAMPAVAEGPGPGEGAAAADALPALVAERITPESFAQHRIGGPDAIGGVGDWALANDRIRIVVDDPSRRYAKLNHGGTIVDAGLRDRGGDDQLAQLIPLVNMSQRVVVGYDSIRA
jgi:hypothetical protein